MNSYQQHELLQGINRIVSDDPFARRVVSVRSPWPHTMFMHTPHLPSPLPRQPATATIYEEKKTQRSPVKYAPNSWRGTTEEKEPPKEQPTEKKEKEKSALDLRAEMKGFKTKRYYRQKKEESDGRWKVECMLVIYNPSRNDSVVCCYQSTEPHETKAAASKEVSDKALKTDFDFSKCYWARHYDSSFDSQSW